MRNSVESSRTKPTATLPPATVECSDGVILVRDEAVFGPGRDDACERFVGRVLSVAGVRSVTLDRARATAAVRHSAGAGEVVALLERLADAIRRGTTSAVRAALPRGLHAANRTIFRHGVLLSSCDVVSDEPGRLHLRHKALRHDRALAKAVTHRLGSIPGVTGVAVGSWTSSLFVRFDPARAAAPRVLQVAADALEGADGWCGSLPKPAHANPGLAYATLGVAALSDTVVPALMPASAVLLIGTNLSTYRTAWEQLRTWKFGLPVVYTAIATTALASGQFLSCALMMVCYRFWHDRLRVELASARRQLLDQCLPRPRFACLLKPEEGEVILPVERLQPADRVRVGPGETLPADGRVIAGEAIVDERSVRGLEGASRKKPGEPVLAGSRVLAGSLTIEVTRHGDRTRASAIERDLVAATSPAPGRMSPTSRTEAFADRAVGPTLATAGVGLLTGDLATVGAILAPDYATGPGLAVPLETLRNTTKCARRGIVVRRADAFERLAEVDLIVIDDDPVLSRLEVEVRSVQSHLPEAEVLRYAASAFRHLADDRAIALEAACRSRRIHLLDLPPVGFSPGVSVLHGRRRVSVVELDAVAAPDGLGSLLLEIDGTAAGVIGFARSARPEAAAALARIREAARAPIALVSNRAEPDVAALASLLGVDMYRSGFSAGEQARFLRACRDGGLRTALIGNGHRQGASAGIVHVAIALASDTGDCPEPAAFLLLQPRLRGIAELWEIARAHEGNVHDAQKLVLAPNVLCVAGAFLFGFSGLTSVMITNLGTFGLYNRTLGSLRELNAADRYAPPELDPARSRFLQAAVPAGPSAPARIDTTPADSWDGRTAKGHLRPPSPPLEHTSAAPELPVLDSGIALSPADLRIRNLPKTVGVMLLSVGVLGVVLPGVMGAPALIAGGLALWPGAFGTVSGWLRRQSPGIYHRGMRQVGRFLDDLEGRYPEAAKNGSRPPATIIPAGEVR
jgi:cation transport ATPase